MDRRSFLRLTSLAALGVLFPTRVLLSEEDGEQEGDPRSAFFTCPHVDAEAALFITENFPSNLACCDGCLGLTVGGVGAGLNDPVSLIDKDPSKPGFNVETALLMKRAGVETLEQLRARDLAEYGFTNTQHELDASWQKFALGGWALTHILHVIEDPRGRRFLSYGAWVPDDYRWYNDPVKPGLAGWVLGAHMGTGADEQQLYFTDQVSKACLQRGGLVFRADALILLD